MRLLNLGCGGVRPGDPWVNADLHGHPAHNFVAMDINVHPWGWPDNYFDGLFTSHVFEHFDAHALQHILRECYRVIKPGGVLRCSVPDAAYFRKIQSQDQRENAELLFGEPIADSRFKTFMGWALFFYGEHRQVFTEDSMWCTLVNWEYEPKTESFKPENVIRAEYQKTTRPGHKAAELISYLDNRPKFSLYMEAFK